MENLLTFSSIEDRLDALEGSTSSGAGVVLSEYASLQAAHDALPVEGGYIYARKGTYTPWSTATVNITKPVHIIGDGPKSTIFEGPSSRYGIDIFGTRTPYASRKLLTANAPRSPAVGTGYLPKLAISTADIAALGIVAGDYLEVATDKVWGFGTAGVSSQSTTQGEIVQVLSVNGAGGLVTLRANLNDTYNTADGAYVLKLTMLSGVTIEGIGFQNTTPQSGTQGFIAQEYNLNCVIRDCIMRDGDSRGVYRQDCLRCGVENVHFYDFMGNGGTGSAYGVSDFNGCQDNWVRGCTGNRMWNVITTNGLAGPGVPRHNLYENCQSWNHYNNAFSAHEEGEYNIYRNLKASGGGEGYDGANVTAGSGLSVRANNTIVENFTGTNNLRNGLWYRWGLTGLVVDGIVIRQQHFYSAGGSAGLRLDGNDAIIKNAVIDGVDDTGMILLGNNNYVEATVKRTGLNGGETPSTSGAVLFSGATYTATGVDSTDLFTANGHGLLNNDRLVFTAKTGGSGLTLGVLYFIRDATANTFKLSLTKGGSVVSLGTDVTASTYAYAGCNNTVRLTAIDCPNAIDADVSTTVNNRVFIEDLVNTATGSTTWVQPLQTTHVAAATPTGGLSAQIKVGNGKIWVNDAGTWKSVAVA